MSDIESTYKKLKQLRKRKDLKLKPNKYINPEYTLRYYQTIGVLHFFMVGRLILGDDTGIGKCGVGDTKIISKRGILKLTDPSLWHQRDFENRKEGEFYDIPQGIKLASDGVKHSPQIYYDGKKPTIKFKTKLGTWGHCTGKHRWKVLTPNQDIIWKKTSELRKGDYVAVGRGQNVWGYKKIDDDLAWLLGFIIGDGHYNIYDNGASESALLAITNTHKPTLEKLKTICKKHFNNLKEHLELPRKPHYKVQGVLKESGTQNVKDFMNKMGLSRGETAHYKKIPKILNTCQKRVICKFLQGLFDADGYISKEGAIELCLASKELIEDIQLYFLNMGIVSGITEKYNKKYKKYYYLLRVLENDGKRKFFNWINFSIDYKQERLRNIVYLDRVSDQTHDIIPFQQEKLKKIGEAIPKGIKWAFKDVLKSRSKNAGELSYRCARKILSFEHEEFFENCKEFQELKEIVSYNYFFTPITEIKDGGLQEVYDLTVPDGNTYLANGMISHNTPTSLIAYTHLKTQNPNLKLMVICPSSVMYQWRSELNKFTIGLESQIVESKTIKYIDGVKLKSKDYLTSFDSREFQFKQWERGKKDVLIFNYNTMSSDYLNVLEDLMQKYEFMVVFDEATAFKNKKAQTWENAKHVSKLAKRAYALSATIIKNDLLEAFAIIHIIMPYIFGNQTRFKKDYCIVKPKQLWKGRGKRGKVIQEIVGYKNLDHFKNKLDLYYLGRKKSQVAEELPKINIREYPITMHPKQEKIYNDVLEGFLDYDKFNFEELNCLIKEDKDFQYESRESKYIDKLTALIYCQQICNSPHTIGLDSPSAKEDEMLRILTDELHEEKVVIYTRFKRMVNRLEDLITKKLKKKVLKITGDIDNDVREEYKQTFNTSTDHNIILINGAAKEGINLQSSGYLVFYDLPFSYGDFLQIIGRIHRIGSKHDKIFLMYLICRNTVDEKTYDILANKKELFDEILGDSAVGAMKTNNKEMINDLFEGMIEAARKIK